MTDDNNPFNPGFYNSEELGQMGFKAIGDNVMIAKNCTIIGLHNISIGNNVRIDGNTVISAFHNEFVVGDYIHIGAFCFFNCADKIILEDYSGCSQGVRFYAGSDDYSGDFMTNPTVPKEFTNVKTGPITVGQHTIIGSGAVILPNVHIGTGCAIGAQSMVTKNLDEWGVYVGCPVRRIKERSKKLLNHQKELEKQTNV